MFSINAAAFAFITALESISGVPIVVLDRIDATEVFWERSATILCEKTGDSFCGEDVSFLTNSIEPSGFSQIIEYKTNGTGPTKRICAILPAIPNIDPVYIAEAFTGGLTVESQYPSQPSMSAWMLLYHAAHCLDSTFSDQEENRAVAFATLGLTILQGDPLFSYPGQTGQSRRIATMIKNDSAWFAAGAGERILLDQFKTEAALELRTDFNCNAAVLGATTIDTTNIAKENSLAADQNCAINENGSRNQGVVSDNNLWIWMYGGGGLGSPPSEYQPVKMFSDMKAAATYTINTASTLSQ